MKTRMETTVTVLSQIHHCALAHRHTGRGSRVSLKGFCGSGGRAGCALIAGAGRSSCPCAEVFPNKTPEPGVAPDGRCRPVLDDINRPRLCNLKGVRGSFSILLYLKSATWENGAVKHVESLIMYFRAKWTSALIDLMS